MKKKLLTMLGYILSTAMLVTSMPVYAFAEQAETVDASSALTYKKGDEADVSENDVILETEETTKSADDILFSGEWRNLSDEELSDAIRDAEIPDVGEWLYSLSSSDREELLLRDTYLMQEVEVADYEDKLSYDSDGKATITTTTSEVTKCKYYEYALENRNTDELRAATWNSSSGKCFLYVKRNSNGVESQLAEIPFTISGLSGTVASGQKYTVVMTANNYVTLKGASRSTRDASYNIDENSNASSFLYISILVNYTRPLSYWVTTTATTDSMISKSLPTLTKYEDYNHTYGGTQDIYLVGPRRNFNLFISSDNTNASTTNGGQAILKGNFTIYETLKTFNIAFDGNGATSGSVATLTCDWANNIAFPANGYTRNYAITYNGNGGLANAASATETWTFEGWGTSPTSGATNAPGGSYAPTAFTSTADATVKYYAQWKAGSVTLPSASREGYTFNGWKNGATNVGAAGKAVTFGSNANLVADWKANQYTIKYVSEDKEVGSQTMTYDSAANLKTAETLELAKQGYVFSGWTGSAGTYTDGQSVNNLATSGTVTLNAVWTPANDTPYTVISKFQTELDSEDYVVDDTKTKILAGTTDTYANVTPDAISGYVTPESQQVYIKADGTAEVVFMYQLVDNRITYKVKHVYTDPETGKEVEYTGTFNGQDEAGFQNEFKANAGQIVSPEFSDFLIKQFNKFWLDKWAVCDGEKKAWVMTAPTVATITLSDKAENTITYTYPTEYMVVGTLDRDGKALYELIQNFVPSGTSEEELQRILTEIKKINGWQNMKESEIATLVSTIVNKETAGAGGLTDAQINEIVKKIAAGMSFTMDIDGVNYEIIQNEDGSFSIKFADTTSKDITIPDLIQIGDKVYRVTEIHEKAFFNNKTLEKVTIGKNVAKIDTSAFEGCTSLKTVNFNEGLTTIGDRAFYGCSGLTEIKTSSTLQTIGNKAFYMCTSLKTLALNEGLLLIGDYAFFGCKSLSKIKLPDSVREVGKYAFGKCLAAKSVYLGKNLSVLKEGAFSSCSSITSVTFPKKLKTIPKKAFYNCKKLKTVKTVTGNVYIGASAFSKCKALNKVAISGSITNIGEKAFYKCTSLKKIKLTSKVMKIRKQAFYGCKNLKTVTITSKVLRIVEKSAFKKCHKKIKFKVPDSKVSSYSKLLKGKY